MNGEDHLSKRAFEKIEKVRFKQCYENGEVRSYKRGFEKSVISGSNKIMRERRSPFIQTCF